MFARSCSACATVGVPKLIPPDEPFEGLVPVIVDDLLEVVRRLVIEGEAGGMALAVVEQHAELALDLTDHPLVLDRGRMVWEIAAMGADSAKISRLNGLSDAGAAAEAPSPSA